MNISAVQPLPDIPLVKAVFGLRDDRLVCDKCLADLPAYVEAEVGGYAYRAEYSGIKRHILLCPDCDATYLELLRLAILDQRDELPKPSPHPQPNLRFLPGEFGDER